MIASLSRLPSAAVNSFLPPMKFVPWSDRNSRTLPRRLINLLNAFKNESVFIELRVSRWTAREAKHVKMIPHLLSSFLPSLI